ncbi:p-hydroxyphenylacetate 3-hydroxylase, reductase component [Rhodoplanes serenus]|jgi:flavin reductase (DIM6/NTAB) family NADH-FMN oxidoreductase RutF|uniref:p-hydroxyphenylacetate 3-hydroxylase, reductase component n=1 Tax=Rhodoplanes serenus TaxID=200615 RepID=A0A3S4B7X7_9BRAD|nr:flavin reductase family protein [Rhodoplanes serenus]MBI5113895.1 flavin reductase family protein [Rhodovulum sp.]VCU11242.1 p-hydroxyphenylacetate 3-hydroxylase, reductase component [Rhodoplanes serenus]
MQDLPFDQTRFRRTLGRFPTGVAVVTGAGPDGAPLGITVSSFNSVSLDPPLILFSIARRANSFAAWQAARHYAVNVLGEDQEWLSDRFARPAADKWEGVTVTAGQHGMPVLPGCLAVLECEAYARHDGGDHEIFVGRVLGLTVDRDGPPRPPLVFFAGRYRKLMPDPAAPEAAGDSLARQNG